jgi:hypothetical protein
VSALQGTNASLTVTYPDIFLAPVDFFQPSSPARADSKRSSQDINLTCKKLLLVKFKEIYLSQTLNDSY